MRMQSFHLSTQGASHIKKNKECQDASESYYDENCAIAIVCDGHGGDDYVRSASGSAFACAAAKECILNFIENVNREELTRHHNKLIHNLNASIISAWNEAIYAHYQENPFTEAEIAVLSERAKRKYLKEQRIESAYGTTLIAVACTKNYWFGIHIGDGKCVAVNPEGRFLQPIPWDDRCFLNATTSICDSDALNRFRMFYSEKLPVAVFVGSDGIDDCFSTEQQLNNLYKTVLYSFATSEFDSAVNDLSDYLPRLSAKGSGDDVSVAAILDLDRIGEISAVKEFDKEKEKARVEENARIAARKAEEERLRVEAERAKQQSAQKATTKWCTKCGTKLLPGHKFCSECGAPVEQAAAAQQAPAKPDTDVDEENVTRFFLPAQPDSDPPAADVQTIDAGEVAAEAAEEETVVAAAEEPASEAPAEEAPVQPETDVPAVAVADTPEEAAEPQEETVSEESEETETPTEAEETAADFG